MEVRYLIEELLPVLSVVSVKSNYAHIENTKFSRALLNEISLKDFMKSIVLFLNTNESRSINKHKTDTQLIQHKARTWNCTLGILMRIQTDSIRLKAL